uniref:Immunoglobulin V-set domain-containing protein n=1 Tax=Oreochromis niloticus TaxID=8128 RepID=A0A669DDW6_ORENI
IRLLSTLYSCAIIYTNLMNVEGFQGRNVSFTCSHKLAWGYDKYFCKDPCESEKDRLTKGRFSMYDNTTGSFFIVRVDKLRLNDSATYSCGVDISFNPDYRSTIKLNVSQAEQKGLSGQLAGGFF